MLYATFKTQVIGIVGCAFGIWYQAGGYTPLVPVPWEILA